MSGVCLALCRDIATTAIAWLRGSAHSLHILHDACMIPSCRDIRSTYFLSTRTSTCWCRYMMPMLRVHKGSFGLCSHLVLHSRFIQRNMTGSGWVRWRLCVAIFTPMHSGHQKLPHLERPLWLTSNKISACTCSQCRAGSFAFVSVCI